MSMYALLSVPTYAWGPWLKPGSRTSTPNDPQRVYQTLKQAFEPDTAANCLDKLSKFLNFILPGHPPDEANPHL